MFGRKKGKKRGQLKDRLSNLTDDLVNLEINTIVKGGITGRPVPKPREALREIALCYHEALLMTAKDLIAGDSMAIQTQLEAGFQNAKEKDASPNWDHLTDSADRLFQILNNQSQPLSEEEEGQLKICVRIHRMSQKLGRIAAKLKPQTKPAKVEPEDSQKDAPEASLNYDEMVAIRKAWEIGSAVIVMQTVIQLDGDVVTRIDPRYCSEDQRALHMLHGDAVKTAVSTWAQLAKMIQSFLDMLVDVIKFKK